MKLFSINLLLSLLVTTSVYAGTYDDHYTVLQDAPKKQNDNTFMNGEFSEIIRFEPLHFDGDEMDDEAQERFDKIVEKIKTYVEKQEAIKVTLIGYTSEATDDMNEQTIDSDTYANAIQNVFRDSEDTNATLQRSKKYAESVLDKFTQEKKLDTSLFVVEYRGGKDPAYTDDSSYAKDLSNRVAVSIYVLKLDEIDSDKDGVYDKYDRCPGTPRNTKVDKLGCPIDSDMDGVLDFKDECSKTPKGVEVDYVGCPIDTDGDGVVDYKDACANTPAGVTTDPHGCPVQQTLALHFKPNSAKITADSEPVIESFAQFLKKNKAYNVEIIGHTDSIGKATVNMKLSQQRAEATKKALVAKGVEASRITTKGRGELDPIESNRTEKGREANRRIEVKLSLQ